MSNNKQYTSDNIKVLNDIEHIQARAGMYIGEAIDPRSLFSEMFDNAMDEVSAGYSTELVVEVDTKENRYIALYLYSIALLTIEPCLYIMET